ncbi:MAG TPA: hypothetical protein VMF65_18700 [Acidimicrobiales bacterium]|nr:hypothetical protein [Acidimicrobiales bacterium]
MSGPTSSSSNARPVEKIAEWERLREADIYDVPWRRWGPYLAERAWGTVREDYSADGDAWSYFPWEQAISRAYRWSEDGMAGICDDRQLLCLALGLWNGHDAIVKERAFGLTNSQGNHGEDVKECWWYLDATPTSSWLQWRYHYPQAAFPYEDLVAENGRRNRNQPEYELVDTGIFDGNRYFVVTVTWAKDGPEDLLWQIEVTNAGPETAPLDVLPTIWYRNRWSWDFSGTRPSIIMRPGTEQFLAVDCEGIGSRVLVAAPGPDGQPPQPLFCDNDTNTEKLWGTPGPRYPKDGINDYLVHGTASVNPGLSGTKAALRYHVELAPGASARFRLRFADEALDLGSGFDAVLNQRKTEADEYFASIGPPDISPEEARVLRQAAAGMLWGKQFYHYDVQTWLDGDPAQPPPPPQRLQGRNHDWTHIFNLDVISMPDPWEYPWYASWDLAFHTVALAHLDPSFAKSQLILLCREWYMHPEGQLPAYEWDFGDVNPPVQGRAAMAVWQIDAERRALEGLAPDYGFLERVFHKLLINFTWWVNRKDAEGNNVFEGGFLGLDNIGLFDRSRPLPVPGVLEQSDGTAWMAMYSISLLEIALRLADTDPTYEDIAIKFFEHFAYIASAMHTQGLWDVDDGFFYDVIKFPDGHSVPVKVRSLVGVVPLLAVTTLHPELAAKLKDFIARTELFEQHRPRQAAFIAHTRVPGMGDRLLLSVANEEALQRALRRVLDPDEMLSPYGVRSLSRYHLAHPFQLQVGGVTRQVDYEPAESTTPLFGGNSNWRGPVWFPLNYLFIQSLYRYSRYYGAGLKVEHPVGSGTHLTLAEVADDITRRLVALFLPGPDGRRPVHGDNKLLQEDPAWRDLMWFHEYFNGDNGAGLGASHQTGWTGLVLHLIASRARPVEER